MYSLCHLIWFCYWLDASVDIDAVVLGVGGNLLGVFAKRVFSFVIWGIGVLTSGVMGILEVSRSCLDVSGEFSTTIILAKSGSFRLIFMLLFGVCNWSTLRELALGVGIFSVVRSISCMPPVLGVASESLILFSTNFCQLVFLLAYTSSLSWISGWLVLLYLEVVLEQYLAKVFYWLPPQEILIEPLSKQTLSSPWVLCCAFLGGLERDLHL